MLQLKQASILGLLLTTVLGVPAQAQKPRVDLELTPRPARCRGCREMSRSTWGGTAPKTWRSGSTAGWPMAKPFASPCINSENEERDLAVMTFELGTAFLKLDDSKADPVPPIFPPEKVEADVRLLPGPGDPRNPSFPD